MSKARIDPAARVLDLERAATSPLTVILVNYASWPHTIECLESLLRSTYENYSIVVVDNASPDGSVESIRAWANGEIGVWVAPNSPHRLRVYPPVTKPVPLRIVNDRFRDLCDSRRSSRVTVIASERNAGFGAGNNLGMAFAVADGACDGYFWLLNNDTVVDADTMATIARELCTSPRILGTRVMEYDRPEETQAVGGGRLGRLKMRTIPSRDGDKRRLEFVNAASMLLPVSFFRLSGGFDEAIFMYQEEIDLCLRARRAGYSVELSSAKVYHKRGVSSSSYRQWLWTFSSQVYVLRKHFGWGPWILAHLSKLIFLSLTPFGSPAKRRAARTAIWRMFGGERTSSK